MVCLMRVNLYGIPSIEFKVELSLVDPQASLDHFDIFTVSHCNGLLLCNNGEYNRIVVWNPCTGQTKWIEPRKIGSYALGSYQANKYGDNSYKILCWCDGKNNEFEIYEINSSSWRTLDVTLDCELEYDECGMSLKGKTYWFASDENEEQLGMFLVSFDYTTERFERLLLPCKSIYYKTLSLSVVGEEKLSVLLQHADTSRTEIWVTNKIDETKVVKWSKVLTVDLKPELDICGLVRFLVDEEKKFLVFGHLNLKSGVPIKQEVYIVGEENKVEKVYSGITSSMANLFDYVPSLTQIQ
ncbi:unnamed protein product [Arabidopsis lyrata]|uniref:F-box associated beta-propeller type 1 domain-containing protein n=1 Tax=Arabidopsis lyrata subsp. lyrata TaxID=81972 RepID=D7LJ11_ARALL|nr:hypothetical protein ARALYDRAFT_901760 [Arabidopsis lyrata subsp. lyrata]CAH8263918.1 unnamed protein product [Arabidopsis lyrata]